MYAGEQNVINYTKGSSTKNILEGGDRMMLEKYDNFFTTVYSESVIDRKTKHLIALAASLAAGCEPWTSYCFAVAKELDIPKKEIDETIAIAMTVGATKIKALADKINLVGEQIKTESVEDKPAEECSTWKV